MDSDYFAENRYIIHYCSNGKPSNSIVPGEGSIKTAIRREILFMLHKNLNLSHHSKMNAPRSFEKNWISANILVILSFSMAQPEKKVIKIKK